MFVNWYIFQIFFEKKSTSLQRRNIVTFWISKIFSRFFQLKSFFKT